MAICAVPGCSCKTYHPNGKYQRMQKYCRKHWLATKSGRVDSNHWVRDIHNFHRKGKCEHCGKTIGQCADEVIAARIAAAGGLCAIRLPEIVMPFRKKVEIGIQMLTGDHKNRRNFKKADFKENIQTLCHHCHRVKSIAHNDLSRYSSKKVK